MVYGLGSISGIRLMVNHSGFGVQGFGSMVKGAGSRG